MFNILSSLENNSTINNEDIMSIRRFINYHYSNKIAVLITRLNEAQVEDHNLRNAINTPLVKLLTACPVELKRIPKDLNEYLINE